MSSPRPLRVRNRGLASSMKLYLYSSMPAKSSASSLCRSIAFSSKTIIHLVPLLLSGDLLALLLPDPIVALLFELHGQVWAARFSDAAVQHDVHDVGLDVIQDALIVSYE